MRKTSATLTCALLLTLAPGCFQSQKTTTLDDVLDTTCIVSGAALTGVGASIDPGSTSIVSQGLRAFRTMWLVTGGTALLLGLAKLGADIGRPAPPPDPAVVSAR